MPTEDVSGEEATTFESALGAEDWRHPSRKLLTLRRLEVGGATLVLAIVPGVLLAVVGLTLVGVGMAGGVLVVGVVAEHVVERRFGAWGYAERGEDLLVRRGVLVTRLSVVPYGRMQFIDVRAGPLERSFGLSTVHLHTATAASDAYIPGLEGAEATRLRDRLAQLGEAQAAGL